MSHNPYKLAAEKGRFVSVDSFDVEIQDSHFYKLNEKVPSLAVGATYNIHIKTIDALTFIQSLKINVGDGPVDIVVLENPTVSDGTTEIPIMNFNRETPTASNSTAYNNSSGISGGTTLERDFIPTGKDTAFVLEDDSKWVLKRNADYVIRIVNNSGQILTFSYTMVYHEHNSNPNT